MNGKVKEVCESVLAVVGVVLSIVGLVSEIKRLGKPRKRKRERMNIRVEVAAATAVVGYDLIQNHVNNRVPSARVIDGIALVGSAAAGDTVIELMVNNKSEGMFSNTATGTAVTRIS